MSASSTFSLTSTGWIPARWDELTSDGGPPGGIAAAGVSAAAGIGAELLRTVPQGPTATVVHGDYRLDNTILHPSRVGEIAAVLDWEMSTLGDPLADLAMLLLYWPESGDALEYLQIQVSAPVSTLAGFPSRRDLVERYAVRTGIEVADLPWYMAFAFFKVGAILQDVVARAEGGRMLGSGFDDVGSQVSPESSTGRQTQPQYRPDAPPDHRRREWCRSGRATIAVSWLVDWPVSVTANLHRQRAPLR